MNNEYSTITIHYANGVERVITRSATQVSCRSSDSAGYVLSFVVDDKTYLFTTLSCAGWVVE